MTGSAVSQFENTSWVFRVQYQMETHPTSQAVWAAESIRHPCSLLSSWPQSGGPVPRVGYSELTRLKEVSRAEGAEVGPPRKWLSISLCLIALAPLL